VREILLCIHEYLFLGNANQKEKKGSSLKWDKNGWGMDTSPTRLYLIWLAAEAPEVPPYLWSPLLDSFHFT
jgi:hypothetical protein